MSRIDAIQIVGPGPGAALTPPQKRFNTLIRQIGQARQTLAAWQEGVVAYRQSHSDMLEPLRKELIAAQRQWVFALDAAIGQRNWTRAERETLVDLLCEAASEMLGVDAEDAEMKALFDKHAEVDFDTEQREIMLAMKGLTEAMTGLDLGDDDDIVSEEELMARMQQGLHERAAATEAERGAKAKRRRKSGAQQRREAEEQLATQSVREIYRKLASALHPDRETDAGQRREKTELMQRVNQAYAANDLLALLELQLRIEQIDEDHIANVGAERLAHFNKVLAQQLAELRAEVDREEFGFCIEFGVEPGTKLNPRRLGEVFEQTLRHWRADLAGQQRDMRMLADVPKAKKWLKRERQRLREEEELGFGMF